MADRASSTVAARRTAAAHGRTRPGAAAAGRPEPLVAEPSATRVLAVRPGEEAWTADEVRDLREELAAVRARMAAELEAMQRQLDEVMRDAGDGAGDDQADTGAKAYEREQGLTFITRAQDTFFQLEQAMGRLDEGTYGDCETCGLAIGKARLQAFPRATVCVSCKQKQERR